MEKSKFQLFVSIVLLIIGIAAMISFIMLWVGGEDMGRWIITLLLAVWLVVIGVLDIVKYKK